MRTLTVKERRILQTMKRTAGTHWFDDVDTEATLNALARSKRVAIRRELHPTEGEISTWTITRLGELALKYAT